MKLFFFRQITRKIAFSLRFYKKSRCRPLRKQRSSIL